MKNKFLFLFFSILILGIGGYSTLNGKVVDENKISITVYKSPDCGCCVGDIAYLKNKGFEVNTIMTEDMLDIKDEHNIPRNMQSCHTAIIGNYFVEGHVPIEAITKLLTEQPDIDGITLPGMPAGTPGMPGTKSGPWVVYGLKDGKVSDFLTI